MSSLAATQADGYYLPPEYFDSGTYKKQSKNQFAGSKGHNQYLQKGIVRFELPYKGICDKCHTSIGRGTRYNAHKVTTDESYFTTPILEFQLTCRNCQHPWKIRTNPQERGFDYVEGIVIQSGQEDVVDMTGGQQTITTSLDRLESMAQGKRKAKTELETLQALQTLQGKTTLEDASLNASIRANFRVDRKLQRLKRQQASKVGWREGMEWLNTTVEDQLAAKTTVYGQAHDMETQRFGQVRKSSIFDTLPATKRRQRCLQTQLSTSLVLPDMASSRSSYVDIPIDENNNDPGSDDRSSTKQLPAVRVKQKIQLSSLIAHGLRAPSSTTLTIPELDAKKPKISSGIVDILAAYGSSDSDSDSDGDE